MFIYVASKIFVKFAVNNWVIVEKENKFGLHFSFGSYVKNIGFGQIYLKSPLFTP